MQIKKLICTLICGVIITSLCGCSSTITEGEVYAKEHREEYNSVMYLPVVASNGKTATTLLIPYYVHYPERYVIFIRAYQTEEWQTEDFYVSKEVYNAVNIGDMFFFDEERGDLKDEPNTRERKER